MSLRRRLPLTRAGLLQGAVWAALGGLTQEQAYGLLLALARAARWLAWPRRDGAAGWMTGGNLSRAGVAVAAKAAATDHLPAVYEKIEQLYEQLYMGAVVAACVAACVYLAIWLLLPAHSHPAPAT